MEKNGALELDVYCSWSCEMEVHGDDPEDEAEEFESMY